jgi:hypothetical protein
VLFALVVNEVLNPLRNFGKIPGVGLAHLAVAGSLVTASWLGYHNSRNRPVYFIRFPSLPLFQFLIDISLVVVYWLAAVSAEGTGSSLSKPPSAVPEAFLVAISFALYVAWDLVAVKIRENPAYERRPAQHDDRARRQVTWVWAFLATAVWVAVGCTDPRTTGPIISIDLGLLVLLWTFRFAKEYVSEETVLPHPWAVEYPAPSTSTATATANAGNRR